ncbi:hypothetical protein NT6N_04590 [Oceaniferula spumae]|uniref:LTD domain-containing protein n=1 Tax=Oceaniferula spumae TaxID=2979115 RepID=A0AAT9FHC4_9BACT
MDDRGYFSALYMLEKIRRVQTVFCAICMFAGLGETVRGEVWISEFMASNDSSYDDADGDSSDWIEIYNDDTSAINLNGWRLTDNDSNSSKWVFPNVTVPAKGFIIVFASGKDRRVEGAELHTNFSLSKSGEYLALVKPNGSVEHEYAPSYPPQATDISYGLMQSGAVSTIVAQGAAGRAGVAQSQSDFNNNFNGWNTSINGSFTGSTWRNINSGVGYERSSGFGNWIGSGGDFESEMYEENSSIFLRLPFNVSDPSAVSSLTLRMRWDAGFVAYINGVQVAADRNPTSLGWNSSATEDRPDGQNDDWENFNINLSGVTLLPGNNLLAIHGLNDRVGSSDMLCFPELDAVTNPSTGTQKVYFTSPTPGAINEGGSEDLAPFIDEVTDAVTPLPQGGAGSAPIRVTALVTETNHPISTVRLFYRVMFGSETQLTMRDDGVTPDETAGDGVYSVHVPTTTMSSGQMLRWRIEARDDENNLGQSPAYLDPNDSDRYYGTMAEAGINTSNLPILHWFVESPSSANTRGGTRSSFFYAGRFYDNIQTDLHGQTTSGFSKKSYDIDFNKGNRFEWKAGEIKAKDINLLTNWADKTKMRNTMAYEIFRDAGAAHHYAFPVRVQQNGSFFSVADMVEDGDDRFLERIGFDPEGALYKMYNRLDGTGGATKKTRKDEDKSDIQALISALNESNSQNARRLYGYDNIDIPETINYLAGLFLAGSEDQGHKNYYVYRDTNITGEWMLIVWDLDLSLGHDWGGQGYFDDDLIWTQNLQFGASNRLKTFIWNSPELNEMYVRRVRSLMDKLLQPDAVPLAQRRMENRINELADLIDPVGVTSDADLDFSMWGSWRDGGSGSTNAEHRMRNQAQRLIDDYLPGRRAYLYSGVPSSNGLGIPSAQQPMSNITIEDVEFLPISNNQDEEYFVLKNRENTAVDISGWQVKGAVEMTFKAGTIIPAGSGNAGAQYVGLLHVAKSSTAFRSRATGAKGGEYRFIQGGYSGQLSARGETIELWDAEGNLIATKTYTGTPSLAQQFLRVSEINYHPTGPTAAEQSQFPGVTDSDFEFIELVNTGSSALLLDGCSFIEGIDYVFPASTTLAAGDRIVIAKNLDAFEFRYGTGLNVVGNYTGSLDNGGERLKLVDALGESILDFEWNDKWYPPSDGDGRTLVVRDENTPFNLFDEPTSWGISATQDGTPSLPNGQVFAHFEGWRYGHFNSLERDDPQIGMSDSDMDNDGRSNWAEYCFGTDPKVPDSVEVTLVPASHSGEVYAAISFPRRRNAFDVVWALEDCDDLAGWDGTNSAIHGTPQVLGGGLEKVILRSENLLNSGGALFLRVHAQSQ